MIPTLKMEAARSFHVTLQCHNPENHNMNLHSCENLKPRVEFCCFYEYKCTLI